MGSAAPFVLMHDASPDKTSEQNPEHPLRRAVKTLGISGGAERIRTSYAAPRSSESQSVFGVLPETSCPLRCALNRGCGTTAEPSYAFPVANFNWQDRPMLRVVTRAVPFGVYFSKYYEVKMASNRSFWQCGFSKKGRSCSHKTLPMICS